MQTSRRDSPVGLPWSTATHVSISVLVAFLAMWLLYSVSTNLYYKTLSPFFYFDHPATLPFWDAASVLASIDCWQAGRDVYAGNVCDPENRSWPYSPLWLRLNAGVRLMDHLALIGAIWGGLFILALRFIPFQNGGRQLQWALAAAFSPATVFALERANADVLMFFLAVFAAKFAAGSASVRLAAYSAITLAAFLKYYPVVMFVLLLRERWRRVIWVSVALAALCILFVWSYYGEIQKTLAVIAKFDTHWGPFTDRFGAKQFPSGLQVLLQSRESFGSMALWNVSSASVSVPGWVQPMLFLSSLALATLIARSGAMHAVVRQMTVIETTMLMTGAAVYAGCFFAGYSVAYRAIFLLLMLPGLLVMRRFSRLGLAGSALRLTPFALVYSMWAPFTQHAIQYLGKILNRSDLAGVLSLVDWAAHELAWWALAIVSLALMGRLVRDGRSALRVLAPDAERLVSAELRRAV